MLNKCVISIGVAAARPMPSALVLACFRLSSTQRDPGGESPPGLAGCSGPQEELATCLLSGQFWTHGVIACGGNSPFIPPELTRNRTHRAIPRGRPYRLPREIRPHPEKVLEVREGALTLLACHILHPPTLREGRHLPEGAQQVVARVFGVRTQPPTPGWWQWGGRGGFPSSPGEAPACVDPSLSALWSCIQDAQLAATLLCNI